MREFEKAKRSVGVAVTHAGATLRNCQLCRGETLSALRGPLNTPKNVKKNAVDADTVLTRHGEKPSSTQMTYIRTQARWLEHASVNKWLDRTHTHMSSRHHCMSLHF